MLGLNISQQSKSEKVIFKHALTYDFLLHLETEAAQAWNAHQL